MEIDNDRRKLVVSSLIAAIASYQQGTLARPFFVVTGDMPNLRDKLVTKGAKEIRLSNFCRGDNVEPDFDALLSHLQTVSGFAYMLGLGEYLALAGKAKAEAELSRLKDLVLADGAKVVVLLRGCGGVLKDFCNDPRFEARQCAFTGTLSVPLSITVVAPNLGIDGAEWLKTALLKMEDGAADIRIKTDLDFPNATIPVRRIQSAYQAVEKSWPGLEDCGSSEDWSRLLSNPSESHRFSSFLALKRDGGDSYLAFAASHCVKFTDFEHEKQFSLLALQPYDPRFGTFYSERKTLFKEVTDAEIAGYVAATKIKGVQRIHYLTDNTSVERKAIVECLSDHASQELSQMDLQRIYPTLADYLRDFDCGQWTEYFRQYKRQKVLNRLDDGWLDVVNESAKAREYNLLPTRDSVIDQLSDKAHTALFFVDALGVEFLGFIQARCATLGLRVVVTLARANLPSLTRLNKTFYEEWTGRKVESRELDKIKHEGAAGGFDYQQNKLPIHLVRELEIVDEMLARVKVELASGASRKAVVASDHGASRLVVVNGQELKYEMDSKGSHSGRCCAVCELPDDLHVATEENGWLVLADYGRFKGGRAAAVEVHGGATNEEVIVPVIELTLAGHTIKVSLVEREIKANYKTLAAITLFSTDVLDGVSVVVGGKRYAADKLDGNRHLVALPDIRKAGDYAAEVYEGDNLIGNITFTVRSGAAQENDLF